MDSALGDKNLRDPKMLLEDFRNVINESGRVEFDEYGDQKEPSAMMHQVRQIMRLYDEINGHPDISMEDKKEIGERMEKAENFLKSIEGSGRYE